MRHNPLCAPKDVESLAKQHEDHANFLVEKTRGFSGRGFGLAEKSEKKAIFVALFVPKIGRFFAEIIYIMATF